MSDWTVTEIKSGSMTVSNEDLEITVFKDFSGEVTTAAGDYMAFEDLRDFIEAGKLLEQALVDHYGGYK